MILTQSLITHKPLWVSEGKLTITIESYKIDISVHRRRDKRIELNLHTPYPLFVYRTNAIENGRP